jgi:hypothetical protein
MIIALILVLVSALSMARGAQQRPDFSGTWTLAADTASGKPTPAPGFGPTINIVQDTSSITISKMMGGGTVHVTHSLDGRETRSRTPGRLCEGDSEAFWTAAWQDDGLLTTYLGSMVPGATTRTKAEIKTLFRLGSPEALVVETIPSAGTQAPRTVTTRYRKVSAPADTAAASSSSANIVQAKIGQVEWLGGTWIGTSGASVFEERWTPPAGGSMLAVSRTIRGGVMSAFEFLCIVERNGGLVYQAMPNGHQPATDFTLTSIESNSLTFENPAHDFPKMIRYTLGPDGTLEAIVSGTAQQKPQTFRFKRQ